MLRTLTDLEDYSIGATDGAIGRVKDYYFDDEAWVIRYFVVETGSWLSRTVLISPLAVARANWATRLLEVSITRQQVRDSPDIDTDKPVTRQHESTYLGYYDYPCYWNGTQPISDAQSGITLTGLGLGGTSPAYRRALEENARREVAADAVLHRHDDHHLRSCKALMKYHIHAYDGGIGHVQGFLVEERTWAIRYMIVDFRGRMDGLQGVRRSDARCREARAALPFGLAAGPRSGDRTASSLCAAGLLGRRHPRELDRPGAVTLDEPPSNFNQAFEGAITASTVACASSRIFCRCPDPRKLSA